jgi:uncharacterized protein (DUF58 family)
LVLTLLGAVLLAVWAYCLAAVLFLILLHRKRAASLIVRMTPEVLSAGREGAVFRVPARTGGIIADGGFSGKDRFFRPPGILIRCALELSTKDGRRLNHVFDPDFLENGMSPFTPPGRGAYYGERDRLLICDALGLFRAVIAVPQGAGPRLLVTPRAAEQAASLAPRLGGTNRRAEPHFLRTDDLTDHRPYVPGDDPRRINWKLYGHAGDLFVREGEPEPPPHSRLVILIDTQTDPGLYASEEGRRGVDLLCENALALALDYAGRGMDVGIGFSGWDPSSCGPQNGEPRCGGPAEIAAVLARPAASPVAGELPLVPEARGVLILALPRDWTGGGAPWSLDRFLEKRDAKQTVDLLFLYSGDEEPSVQAKERGGLEESAEACARFYGRFYGGKGGVRAKSIRV